MKGITTVSVDIVDDGIRKGLFKSVNIAVIVLMLVLSLALFYYAAVNQRYALIDDFTGFHQAEYIRITSIAFTCVFAVTFLFQIQELRRMPLLYVILAAVMTGLVLLGKISLLDYQSDDYEIFLSGWIYEYSEMSLWQSFGTYIGSDYSPPYLYFLAFISRIKGFPWLYLIKAISISFDALLAFGIMKLAGLKYESPMVRLGAFFITLVLPTVVFNGAYWAQCDAIYTSLCILAIYLALKKRDLWSFLVFGISLSFKLQTIFFLPVLMPLWLRKDIRLRGLILIPAGYMLMMLPALLAGKSLHHVLTVYFQQASQYNYITMNGPSLYELMPVTIETRETFYRIFSQMAMLISIGFVLSICILLSVYRGKINHDAVLLTALLFLTGVPFLLPKMHDRYTFGADAMALAVCFYRPRRRVLLPVCFGLSSYILYTCGLSGEAILEQKWAALLSFAGIIITFVELVNTLKRSNEGQKTMDMLKA